MDTQGVITSLFTSKAPLSCYNRPASSFPFIERIYANGCQGPKMVMAVAETR